ncbi:MAG: hypothetical protein J0M17_16465 [Planctomycetes bacterium]|nr:hypothetical protein [Planctomycetota bacterium]
MNLRNDFNPLSSPQFVVPLSPKQRHAPPEETKESSDPDSQLDDKIESSWIDDGNPNVRDDD